MLASRSQHGPGRRPRRGFTLVELLVVILIMGVIISLTAGAAFLVLSRQRLSNTETVVKMLAVALDQNYRAVIDQAKTEPPPQAVLTMAGGDSQRAQVIWVKLRLKQEFPMNFTELLAPYGPPSNSVVAAGQLPQVPSYVQGLTNQMGNGISQIMTPGVLGTLPTQACEPSVCLLLALQRNRRGVNFDMDSLPSGTVVDGTYLLPDGVTTVTVKQLVDGWGTPLAFYRWPTGCADLNPVTSPPLNPSAPQAQPGNNDPEDPTGTLNSPTWQNNYGTTFTQLCHALAPPAPVPVNGTPQMQPFSFRLIPTIVSAGPNLQFGIPTPGGWTPDPMDTTGNNIPNPPDVYDNIYSYQLLSLGARGGS